MALLLLLFFGLLHHGALAALHNAYNDQTWREAGQYLSQYLDPSKKPCQHFYEHVCGKYGDENEDQYRTDNGDRDRILRQTVLDLVLAINSSSNETSPIEKGVRDFYDQCMLGNENQTDYADQLRYVNERVLSEILFASFNETQAFANDSETSRPYTKALKKILVTIVSFANSSNSTDLSPEDQLDQYLAAFNVWRFAGALERETARSNFYSPLQNFIQLFMGPANNRRGARFTLIPAYRNATLVSASRFQRTSIAELPALIPSIDWEAYWDEIAKDSLHSQLLLHQNETVVDVFEPERFIEMGHTLSTGKGKLLHVFPILAAYSFLSLRNSTVLTAEVMCTDAVIRTLPAAIARLYFKSIDQNLLELHRDIVVLTRNIVSAFQFLINNVDWLDARQKDKLQRKIEDIRFHTGIPSWISDDVAIENDFSRFTYLPELNFFENELRWSRISLRQQLEQALDVGDAPEEKPTFEINGGYRTVANTVKIYLGLIISLRYQTKYPLAVKYGGLGYIIGHELMHALDVNGVYTPGPHMEEEWLDVPALLEFEKRKECLVRQYSKYCYPNHNACVNGTKNIGENMVDIDGLKIAYTAFKFASQVFGDDPPIPALLHYTQDQLFFLATSRWRCERGLDPQWMDDPHTPSKPRIDVMLRNVPLFARSFQCTTGSTYAPLKICSLWGDLENPAP